MRCPLFVGYAQSDLKAGGTMATAQFLNVSNSEAMPLESIVPVGDGASDTVEIQTLTAGGYTDGDYMWIDYAGEGWDEEGWIDNNAELGDYYPIVTGVTFAPGQGLWIFGQSGLSVQSAGKVGTSDVVVNLRSGGTATGNPFPVSVNLADIIPVGDGASDTVEIQTLTAGGYTDADYMWIDYAGEGWDEEGWIDNNAELGDYYPLVTDVTFEPGQGLWVFGQSGLSIRFPAPEL